MPQPSHLHILSVQPVTQLVNDALQLVHVDRQCNAVRVLMALIQPVGIVLCGKKCKCINTQSGCRMHHPLPGTHMMTVERTAGDATHALQVPSLVEQRRPLKVLLPVSTRMIAPCVVGRIEHKYLHR